MNITTSAVSLNVHNVARENVAITMPLTAEEWGERAFQARDPNGVIVQLVDWNGPVIG